MACCHKEYAEVCEILVFVDAPAPHTLGPYQGLRFGLLASSWLPRPLGVFLWSALHVILLIVSGPVFWVLCLLTASLYSVIMFGFCAVVSFVFYVLVGVLAVVCDSVRLLVELIVFCWTLVGLLACHEPRFEWWCGAFCITSTNFCYTKEDIHDCVDHNGVPMGVPCMSGSLYKETKNQKLKIWARWCQEVVHMHEVIAL